MVSETYGRVSAGCLLAPHQLRELPLSLRPTPSRGEVEAFYETWNTVSK